MGHNQDQDQDQERTTVNEDIARALLRQENRRKVRGPQIEAAKQKSRKRNKAAAQSRRRNRR